MAETASELPGTHRRLRRLLAEGPDVTANTRAVMLANRGKDTAPEMAVRRALNAAGLRYRLHVRGLPGRPDVVLASRRAVVEVRGCFWHGHSCQRSRTPKTRTNFWADKINVNRDRDARNEAALRELGWDVVIVWECEVKLGAARLVADRLVATPKQGRLRG